MSSIQKTILGILTAMVCLIFGVVGLMLWSIVQPDESFSYLVRVQEENVNQNIANAKVIVEVAGEPPLDGVSDTNGVVNIRVSEAYSGNPGRLLVEATGYEPYRQEITLYKENLPDTIPLKPISRIKSTSSNSGSASIPVLTATSITINTPLPAPTPSPTATPTLLPTNTPTMTPIPTDTPSPTPPPVPIPLSGLTILLQDDFSSPEWLLWGHLAGYDSNRVEYKNGEVVLFHDDWGQPAAFSQLKFDNFIVEFDVRWSGGQRGGQYGARFRYEDNDNFYNCYISNDGRFEIGKRSNDTDIVLMTGFSDGIDIQGGVNRFHIEANGPNLRCFVNGHLLGEVQDVDHRLGDIALIAKKAGDNFEASFDNVIIAKHP